MRYAEEPRRLVNTEELLRLMEAEKVKKIRSAKSLSLRHALVAAIASSVLFAAFGAATYLISSDVKALRAEVADLKNFKAQAIAADPKIKIASLEAKVEEHARGGQTVRDDLNQLKKDVEEFRARVVARKGR